MSIACAASNVIILLSLKYVGKRKLAIFGVFMSALMSICLGIYIRYKDVLQMPWLFNVLLLILSFENTQCGMIPWLMMGEVFPVRFVFINRTHRI